MYNIHGAQVMRDRDRIMMRGVDSETMQAVPARPAAPDTDRVVTRPLCALTLQYNSTDYTLGLLESMVRHEARYLDSYRIVVMDNGSEDPRSSEIMTRFPFVEFVRYEQNHGYVRAHNMIWTNVVEDWALLINNDCILQNDAIHRTLAAAQDRWADFATCAMLNVDGSPQVSFGPAPTPVRQLFVNCSGINRLLLRRLRLRLKCSRIGFSNGAFLLLRTSLLRHEPLFNEDYYMYGSDMDLMIRFAKRKLNGYRFGDGRVVHIGAGTAGRFWTPQERLRMQGEIYRRMMAEHYPIWWKGVLSPLGRLMRWTGVRKW